VTKVFLAGRDALILAAAELARCTCLWSEDFSPGSIYGMLRVENPLAT